MELECSVLSLTRLLARPSRSRFTRYGRNTIRTLSSYESSPKVRQDHGTQQPPSSRVFMISKHRAEEAYSLPEALRALRAYSLSEIPETVELSIKVNLTLKKNKVREPFKGTLVYPHKFGSQQKVLLLAEDTTVDEVANSGADIIGSTDYIKKIESGAAELSDFDVCVCTTDIYDKIKPLQKKLRAKMPSTRRGTVVELSHILQTVLEYQQSRQYECDKKGYVNMPVGKLNFSDEHLHINIRYLLTEVASHRRTLPITSFVKRAVLSTTYGPGFHLITHGFMS